PVQPNLSPPVQPNLSLETPNWHTNSPSSTSQTEQEERGETRSAPPPPPLEWITFGNGCRATVQQVAVLKEEHGPDFEKVVVGIVAYAATNTVRDFFALARRWRVRQPERRRIDGERKLESPTERLIRRNNEAAERARELIAQGYVSPLFRRRND